MRSRIAALAAGALLCATGICVAAAESPLQFVGRTELPGYTGDFDHFGYDVKGNRLWLAAEDHGTLDVFDLKTGKMRASLEGVVDTPHNIVYLPASNRLIVTDTGAANHAVLGWVSNVDIGRMSQA